MNSILIHIKNKLLLQSLELALKKTNDFLITICNNEKEDEIITKCSSFAFDIIFLDIARSYAYSINERKSLVKKIRKVNKKIKIAIFCDSNSEPDMALEVKELKREKIIDAFFYESVDENYLVAVLETL